MSETVPTNRAPRILILGEAAAIHTRRWVAWFRHRGWVVRWLSFPPVAGGADAEIIPRRHRWRAMGIVLNVSHVRRIIDEFKPDVLSALFLPDYGWLAALTKRHPLAVSAWGSDVLIAPAKSRLHRWRIESVLRSADLVFADAELLRDRMEGLGADPGRIHIIPLGVDPAWVDIGESRSVRANPPTRIVSTRRLEPLYQVDVLLRAVSRLSKSTDRSFQLVVVGDGSQRAALESLSHELGVSGIVAFAGAVSDDAMRMHLSQADLYVSCSVSDGTSVSLLEAMATGCLPIVTDLPANREWITHETNGLLFPVGDDSSLADALRRSIGDLSLREQSRRRNTAIIRERALWPENMSRAESLLLSLTGFGERLGPRENP
ncbi:MAG: glycosyltransferase family 4 protein [Candidatus Zixiibacteriota bacterium]